MHPGVLHEADTKEDSGWSVSHACRNVSLHNEESVCEIRMI